MKKVKCLLLLFIAVVIMCGCGSSKQLAQIDQMLEYPGGLQMLDIFLTENIHYPEASRQAGIQGVVMVSFIVEEDGSVTNCSITQSLNYECDHEALRVVEKMPKWKPGMNDGKPVRVGFFLPIRFQLPEKERSSRIIE